VEPVSGAVAFTYPWGALQGGSSVTIELTGGSGGCQRVRIEPDGGTIREEPCESG